MPALDNPNWEHFAKDLALGMTQRAAYKANGFKAKDVDSSASKLSKNPKVAARIEELKRRATDAAIRKASDRVAITKEYVIEELLDNARLAKDTGQASAVRNRALELIGKELGMFRDLEPVKAPTLADLSTEDLEKLLAQTPIDADPPTAAPSGPPETTQ